MKNKIPLICMLLCVIFPCYSKRSIRNYPYTKSHTSLWQKIIRHIPFFNKKTQMVAKPSLKYPIRRSKKLNLTVSVITPCVARHFFWLAGMLENFQNQTVPPHEIVISLSEVEKLNPAEIDLLEYGTPWSFTLKIIRNKGIILDGENKNIAAEHASSDILICNDADDIPHPQRVEIIKYLFENYELDHIGHSYSRDRGGIYLFNPTQIDKAEMLKFTNYEQAIQWSQAKNRDVHSGSPCFTKKVAAALKWQGSFDVKYNEQVYRQFTKNIIIMLPLLMYRNNLSSFGRN